MTRLILGLILGLTSCTYQTTIEEEDMGANLEDKTAWQVFGQLTRKNTLLGVALSANFKEAGNYTVQFDIQLPEGVASQPCIAFAEITWSIEGNDVRRIVSVAKGMSVSGMGQGVKVVVRDASTGGTAISYNVSVTVARGTRGAQQQPPYYETNTLYSVVGGANQLVDVPVNAGVLSVYVPVFSAGADLFSPIPGQSVLVSHVDNVGNDLKAYDPRDFQWVPLSPGTVQIKIDNNPAGPDIIASVIFGIDG